MKFKKPDYSSGDSLDGDQYIGILKRFSEDFKKRLVGDIFTFYQLDSDEERVDVSISYRYGTHALLFKGTSEELALLRLTLKLFREEKQECSKRGEPWPDGAIYPEFKILE